MNKGEFLAGKPFELPVPQFGRVYRYQPTDNAYMGALYCADRYTFKEWFFFAHIDDITGDGVKVVGYWFTELLAKSLLFADMERLTLQNLDHETKH